MASVMMSGRVTPIRLRSMRSEMHWRIIQTFHLISSEWIAVSWQVSRHAMSFHPTVNTQYCPKISNQD